MATSTRSQNLYDHRLKDHVQETGDVRFAVEAGVPSSTARGWLSSPRASVVTLDVFDSTKKELEREVLMLRRRNEVLRAVLRVLVVALKVTGFSLANFRVPEGARKARFLRAVERSRDFLRLRSILHLLRISPARYYAWMRSEERCDLDDHSSCPRSSPHRLTPEEISAIRDLVTSPDHRHVPTGTLAVLAQRLGKVFVSATTWYRLVRDRGWRRPRQRVHPEKPRVGIRASKPNEICLQIFRVLRLRDVIYPHGLVALEGMKTFTQVVDVRDVVIQRCKHQIRIRFRLNTYPCSICAHRYSRLESCLCFFFHGRSSAGTFTPRGLAVSSLNRFPSQYGKTV
jgi:putative transposase